MGGEHLGTRAPPGGGSKRTGLRARAAARLFRFASAATLLVVGAGGALASCGTNDVPRAALAEGCAINTDCNQPLVCAFKRCHNQCKTSRDCPPNATCVASDRPFAVCQLESEIVCTYNSDCHGGQVCGRDAKCRDQCVVSGDCVRNQICTSGTCVDLADPDLRDGGLIAVDASDDASSGQSCAYSSDCPDVLVCKSGVCAYECFGDKDCGGGKRCVEHRCVAPDGGTGGAAGMSGTSASTGTGTGTATATSGVGGADAGAPGMGKHCNLQSDCKPYGLVCGLGGECVYQCNDDVDCAGPSECCVKHWCAVGPACPMAAASSGASSTSASSGGGDAGACGCVSDVDCSDGKWCDGEERCVAGCCAPPLDTPCDSHASCILDFCTEPVAGPVGKCVHQVQDAGLPDKDKDGYIDVKCGGDDCDDNDATVHPGAPERCDGKDNDCNGIVDDYAKAPRGATCSDEPWDAVVPIGTTDWITCRIAANIAVTCQTWGAPPKAGANCAVKIPATVYAPWPNPNNLPYFLFDMASEAKTALVLGYTGDYRGFASVINDDLTSAGTVLLTVANGASYGGSAVWTGSSYFVAWMGGSYVTGYALVGTDGNLVPNTSIHDVPTMSHAVAADSGVHLAATLDGVTLAVAYKDPDQPAPDVRVAFLNTQGTPLSMLAISAPADASPVLRSITGTKNGFVVVWTHDSKAVATVVSVKNVNSPSVIGTVMLPDQATFLDASVASDGAGVAFGILKPSGASFAYAWGDTLAPFEAPVSAIVPDAAGTDRVGIRRSGGRFTVSYLQTGGSRVYWRDAGCLP